MLSATRSLAHRPSAAVAGSVQMARSGSLSCRSTSFAQPNLIRSTPAAHPMCSAPQAAWLCDASPLRSAASSTSTQLRRTRRHSQLCSAQHSAFRSSDSAFACASCRPFDWGTSRPSSRKRDVRMAAGSVDSSGEAVQLQSSESDSDSSTSRDGGEAAAAAPEEDSSVATIQLGMPRRSLQVTFTCNQCGARTQRMVNPVAWDRGMVMAQCSGCEAWHKLRDAGNLVEEIRYTDEDSSGSGSTL